MLQEVRALSKEAFFGEDSIQKAADRGTVPKLPLKSISSVFTVYIYIYLRAAPGAGSASSCTTGQ